MQEPHSGVTRRSIRRPIGGSIVIPIAIVTIAAAIVSLCRAGRGGILDFERGLVTSVVIPVAYSERRFGLGLVRAFEFAPLLRRNVDL